MSDKIYKKIINRVPNWQKIYTRITMDLAQHIYELLKKEGKSQVELARVLGKHESEISKWLSGNHNFTLKSIAKLEDILESRIIFVPIEFQGYIMKPDAQFTTKAARSDSTGENIFAEPNYLNKKPMFERKLTLKNKAMSYQDAA